MLRVRYHLVTCLVSLFFSPIGWMVSDSFAQTPQASQTVNVSGVWKGSRHYMGFSTEVTFELKQTNEKITGTATWGLSPSGLGGTGGAIEGAISENKITYKIPTANFSGEVEVGGDEIKGTLVGPYPYDLVLRKEK